MSPAPDTVVRLRDLGAFYDGRANGEIFADVRGPSRPAWRLEAAPD